MKEIKTKYQIHMLRKGVWIFSATRDYNETIVQLVGSDEHQLGWFCEKCSKLNKSCYCNGLENFIRTVN